MRGPLRYLKILWDLWRIRRDPVGYARSLGVKVGRDCYLVGIDRSTFGSEPYLITLGDRVAIAQRVQFITHDGAAWVFRQEHPDLEVVAPIKVGNNVGLGIGSIIMPGVTIGDNSIVAAGALVMRDIPPGHIAAGAPARSIQTIEQYWEAMSRRAITVHTKVPEERRRIFEKHFMSGRNEKG